MARLVSQGGCHSTRLSAGWTCRTLRAGEAGTPMPADGGGWWPATVPGTVATGRMLPDEDLHSLDHWYRLRLDLRPGSWLEFAGLATVAEVWIDGALAARSRSMFRRLLVPVPATGGECLDICFRALRPALRQPGPRARWRGGLADEEALRHHRTTLLGHMPGWSGDAPVVGPFRPVLLHEPVDGLPLVTRADLRTTVGADGSGLVSLRLEGAGLHGLAGTLSVAGHAAAIRPVGDALAAELTLPDPPLWWPHTHGEPALVPLTAEVGGSVLDFGRIGFRTIEQRDPADGFGLRLNGTPVFCRGAIWAGLDATAAPADPTALAASLHHARRAGLNMLRVPGMTAYETPEFFELCDRLGIMVWHDFMFARFDYPRDREFADDACAEAGEFLDGAQAHPCLAVLCGGTEVAQAAAMSGAAPAAWHMPLFETDLAHVAARRCPDVPYVAHSPLPHGADALPFAAAASVAHYFGLGAYQRPLDDVAAAGVRFASECLAFANLPEPASGCPRRGAVPRDPGASWDFADVRDHYARLLFGDAVATRRRQDGAASDDLGRAAVALVMQHALATWRSDGRCAGALVLMLQDVLPGAGWGIIAHDGRPKSALYALHHVCQPIQVLLRDHGHNGMAVALLNETAAVRPVRVGLRGLRPDGTAEALGETVLDLPARLGRTVDTTALMGRWRDLANAWQFGSPSFTVLGATLDDADTGRRLSDAVHFPTGPALPQGRAGLAARVEAGPDGWSLAVSSQGFAQFVRIDDEAFVPADSYFHLWPGETRVVALHPRGVAAAPFGTVGALNALAPAHYGMAA